MNAARRKSLSPKQTPEAAQVAPPRVRIELSSDWYLSPTGPHYTLENVLLHILNPKTGGPEKITSAPGGGIAEENPIQLARANMRLELYAPVPYRARLTQRDGTEIYSWTVNGKQNGVDPGASVSPVAKEVKRKTENVRPASSQGTPKGQK